METFAVNHKKAFGCERAFRSAIRMAFWFKTSNCSKVLENFSKVKNFSNFQLLNKL